MDIRPRSSWGAAPARGAHRIAPTPRLWLHHTAGPASQSLRAIQDYHQRTKGWRDIAYSFLVDQHGVAFEGRGPLIAGGHTAGDNTTSHAICAIGNYSGTNPTPEMLETIAQLVAHGHHQGWWTTRRITGGHREAPGAATACPGDRLQQAIPDINRRAADIINGATPAPPPSKDGFLMSLTAKQQLDMWHTLNGIREMNLPLLGIRLAEIETRLERIEHHLNIDGHDKDKDGHARPSYPIRILQDTNAIRKAISPTDGE